MKESLPLFTKLLRVKENYLIYDVREHRQARYTHSQAAYTLAIDRQDICITVQKKCAIIHDTPKKMMGGRGVDTNNTICLLSLVEASIW